MIPGKLYQFTKALGPEGPVYDPDGKRAGTIHQEDVFIYLGTEDKPALNQVWVKIVHEDSAVFLNFVGEYVKESFWFKEATE